MMAQRVVVVSKDKYWLDAVTEMSDQDFLVVQSFCEDDVSVCVTALNECDAESLLLIDTGLPGNITDGVVKARERGWRYVVPVAAAPFEQEARALLRAGACDYWTKTYNRSSIRQRLHEWVDQMK